MCGESVDLTCNGSGSPLPSMTWIYRSPSTVSRETSSFSTDVLGYHKYRYTRHLFNVQSNSQGLHQLLANNGLGDVWIAEYTLLVTCMCHTKFLVIDLVTYPGYRCPGFS